MAAHAVAISSTQTGTSGGGPVSSHPWQVRGWQWSDGGSEMIAIIWIISGWVIVGVYYSRSGMYDVSRYHGVFDVLFSWIVTIVCGAVVGPFGLLVWLFGRSEPTALRRERGSKPSSRTISTSIGDRKPVETRALGPLGFLAWKITGVRP